MNKLNLRLLTLTLFCLFGLMSCEDDTGGTTPMPNDVPAKSLFILNEGGFGNGNASISLFDLEEKTMSNDLFQSANDYLLGDTGQSIYFDTDRAYIVVNNSQKIEVVDAESMASFGQILGLSSPRYILPLDDEEALVSNLYTDSLDLVSLSNLSVLDPIALECASESIWSCGNERMLLVNDKAIVMNQSRGGVLKVDIETMEVEESSVGEGLPNTMEEDKDGNIWMLTTDFYDPGLNRLYKFSPDNIELVTDIIPNVSFPYASYNMIINNTGDYLYFNEGDHISKMGINQNWSERETVFTKEVGSNIYGFALDSEEETLYLGDAKDFTMNGELILVDLASGEIDSRYEVGAFPSKFYFR